MVFSSKELSTYLSSAHNNASKLDKLKIIYRPYICPFDDLIVACKDSKTILDIGCGSGQFLLLLSKYTNAVRLGGIEISPTLINNAKELLTNQSKIEFQIEVYDGINIPDFVHEFDTLTLIDVFHHIKRGMRQKFISDLYKKMKPGSKLIFKDIDGSHPLLFMSIIHDLLLAGEAVSMISVSKAKEMLAATGFSIVSVSKKLMLWYPHYTIICVK
jgi:cyclopropane fatty-acyl-phospholipid synthase-like methyltransferase